jgi:hypothetical protein
MLDVPELPDKPVKTDRLILVCGSVQSGKSTARKLLSQYLERKGGSCSDVIYAILARRKGITVDQLRTLPKEEVRPELIALGNAMCAADPLYLIGNLVWSGCSIIDGVRRKEEFKAAVHRFSPVTIWVENPNSPQLADNNEIVAGMCMHKINNSGTVADLALALESLVEHAKTDFIS